MEQFHSVFEAQTEALQGLNKDLQKKAAEDPRVELLKTMPMVGVIAALTLIAAVDDETRFSTSRQLISYRAMQKFEVGAK